MLAVAIVLIVLGVVLGFLFPVMFVAAAAGIALLAVFFFGAGRRAKTAAAGAEAPRTPPE